MAGKEAESTAAAAPTAVADVDDFGLPIRRYIAPPAAEPTGAEAQDATNDADDGNEIRNGRGGSKDGHEEATEAAGGKNGRASGGDPEDAGSKSAQSTPETASAATSSSPKQTSSTEAKAENETERQVTMSSSTEDQQLPPTTPIPAKGNPTFEAPSTPKTPLRGADSSERYLQAKSPEGISQTHNRDRSFSSPASGKGISEFSHQHLLQREEKEDEKKKDEDDDGGWQEMPSYARYDMYDDDDRLIAREHDADEDETYGYAGLGGAGKGYTRVIMDEDAESATSMDEHTQYLFKNPNGTSIGEDEEARDAVSQMQATKDLLTEGQRIAYVGVVRLEIVNMVKEAESLPLPKSAKRQVLMGAEAVKMWGQKMMIRLYSHMDISDAEQIMIEQLAEHGVMAQDLTAALLANSRVQNPMAEEKRLGTPRSSRYLPSYSEEEKPAEMPPPYETHTGEELPEVKTPSQMPTTEKIDKIGRAHV